MRFASIITLHSVLCVFFCMTKHWISLKPQSHIWMPATGARITEVKIMQSLSIACACYSSSSFSSFLFLTLCENAKLLVQFWRNSWRLLSSLRGMSVLSQRIRRAFEPVWMGFRRSSCHGNGSVCSRVKRIGSCSPTFGLVYIQISDKLKHASQMVCVELNRRMNPASIHGNQQKYRRLTLQTVRSWSDHQLHVVHMCLAHMG